MTTESYPPDAEALKAALKWYEDENGSLVESETEQLTKFVTTYLQHCEKPIAWKWDQLMHDYMGGWEQKIETYQPSSYINPKDIENLRPLYSAPLSSSDSVIKVIRDLIFLAQAEHMCLLSWNQSGSSANYDGIMANAQNALEKLLSVKVNKDD